MKLGVICDGISRDLEHTVSVMNEFDLTYAELQFVWDHEVGDHSGEQIKKIDQICRDNGKPVSCLSRHIFAGMTTENRPGCASSNAHGRFETGGRYGSCRWDATGADHDPKEGTDPVGLQWC